MPSITFACVMASIALLVWDSCGVFLIFDCSGRSDAPNVTLNSSKISRKNGLFIRGLINELVGSSELLVLRCQSTDSPQRCQQPRGRRAELLCGQRSFGI